MAVAVADGATTISDVAVLGRRIRWALLPGPDATGAGAPRRVPGEMPGQTWVQVLPFRPTHRTAETGAR